MPATSRVLSQPHCALVREKYESIVSECRTNLPKHGPSRTIGSPVDSRDGDVLEEDQVGRNLRAASQEWSDQHVIFPK